MQYAIWGKVIRGKNRGKKLGIPTVNLRLHKNIPEGIYVSTTTVGKKLFKSVSFVGAAKTFREKEIYLETYVFDFNQDIYGRWVSVRLLKKIRDNQKFTSVKELVTRIEKDKLEALEYFKKEITWL